jgi:hypothetical protein
MDVSLRSDGLGPRETDQHQPGGIMMGFDKARKGHAHQGVNARLPAPLAGVRATASTRPTSSRA